MSPDAPAVTIRRLATYAARGHTPPPTPCLVGLTIHRPKGGALRDADNAQPTWKAAIDGFTDAGLWPDDSRQYVIGPHARIAPKNRADTNYVLEFAFIPQEVAW